MGSETELWNAVEDAVEASMQTPLREPLLEGVEKTQRSGTSKAIALIGMGFIAGYIVARRGD